jgi:N-acetylneuraminic acid mutarotase
MAECLTQKTAIFFINGVNNTEDDAIQTKDLLKNILKQFSFFNPECVEVKYAYNRTEGLTTDILETARQREIEEDLTPTNFWEMFARLVPPRPWFTGLMATVFLASPTDPRDSKILDQILEHLAQYRAEPSDNRILFLAHSQGTLFANEEWLAMTAVERAQTRIVAVATPAESIADGGPYTTIEEDKLITNIFVRELPWNIPEPNRDDGKRCPDDWFCHGIETSYLFPATASRVKILADIKRALPEASPPPDTWVSRSPLPTPRYYLTAASVGGKIYTIGGQSPDASITGLVDVYDTVTNAWTLRTPMPTSRVQHSIAAANGKIYVFGGCTACAGVPGTPVTAVEEYNPVTDAWSTKGEMATHRRGPASCTIAGKIYVTGGTEFAGERKTLTIVEAYDPATDTWETKAPMLLPRAYHACATVHEKLYVFTGAPEPTGPASVEEYDPLTDTWTAKTSIPTLRSAPAVAAAQGKIYVIGGTWDGPTAVNEAYDPATNIWETRASLPARRFYATATTVGGRIYVIGGVEHTGMSGRNERYTPPE